MALFFSGKAPRQSADAFYPFFTNRNFLYLSGMDEPEEVLMMIKNKDESVQEILYIQPNDALFERWNGKRPTPDEARSISGIEDIHNMEDFEQDLHAKLQSGNYSALLLDLFLLDENETPGFEHLFANRIAGKCPWISIENSYPILKSIRTIKKPCEIEAIKKAVPITKAGIEAMMKASRPGMYEYECKAEFDHALTSRGVLSPGFPSIISAGPNNFCIHYYAYSGQAKDGDLILNDVGACYDHLVNDVSRAFPCNGRFTQEQKDLYTCAYSTSQYMFSIIKPGMPMASVDQIARRYCFEQLKAFGKLESYDEIGTYMWHGGAHHFGFDVHDVVDMDRDTAPGMVFCVDIGIYDEQSGIDFRLEDNCLVTEDGCENLTASIPRSIEEIEAFMAEHNPYVKQR